MISCSTIFMTAAVYVDNLCASIVDFLFIHLQPAPLSEYKRDVIKFGEIVHAPPALKTLPRKANKDETVPRPGRKANLLLRSLIADGATATTQSSPPSKKKVPAQSAPTKLQMKGKRKDLPAATRNMLEGERNKMVDLYRQLKKKQIEAQHGS